MRPICIPCKRFLKVKKTGFYFIEGMPIANDALPGNAEPERWKPYKIWVGDLMECPDCQAQMLAGFSGGPLAHHHEDNFEERVEQLGADQFQVNDC